MLELLDVVGETYSLICAIGNYIAFGSLVLCCLYVFWASTVGQISKGYKQAAIVALIWVCVLIGIHVYFSEALGIPIIVPPVESGFFLVFMRVIQYFASIAVILLCAILFIAAVLKNFDGKYGQYLVSALLFLIILIGLHMYILDEFGVAIIFPPNLW
jgi:hypothetical protein